MRKKIARHHRVSAIVVIGILAGIIGLAAALPVPEESNKKERHLPPECVVLDGGLKAELSRQFPETIASIAAASGSKEEPSRYLVIGTKGRGNVYKFSLDAGTIGSYTVIGEGLGDDPRSGTCAISGVVIQDINHDGKPELLALTDQISPMAKPRVYVWSLNPLPQYRGVAFPSIRSSWSHGPAIIERPESSADSLVVVYCGFGEMVEYSLAQTVSPTGFRSETVAWKQVGQLPASGESAVFADVDNDGAKDICVATGFRHNEAAIQIYESKEVGTDLKLKRTIDEEKRFANVKLLVGAKQADNLNEVFAWWSTGLDVNGDCEFIRYLVGPEGIREREVIYKAQTQYLWPSDNQSCFADLDGDHVQEVYFATHTGHLWRYDQNQESVPVEIFQSTKGIGAIQFVDKRLSHEEPILIVGSGQDLIQIRSIK